MDRARYDAALFDLDGTLLDTLEDLKNSLNYALAAYGYPPRTKDDVRRFLGDGIAKLIERSAPQPLDGDSIQAMRAVFTEHYRVHCADNTYPYPGITGLLTGLRARGLKTAVVSNKADFATQSLCAEFFPGLFDFVVGERKGVKRKPAPDSVREALLSLNVAEERAVYIGDSDVDILTAKNAGLDCVSVCWGFRDEDFLRRSGASLTVFSAGELKKIILS